MAEYNGSNRRGRPGSRFPAASRAGLREASVRHLLDAVADGDGVSQRSLAGRVGIALGLTNLLLKRIVQRGWVRVTRVKPNRVRYLITPAGIAEKARMTRNYLRYSVDYYLEARERIGERLLELSAEWPPTEGPKRIVFWGAGEVAEIAYVCLQETDLQLIGVVDQSRTRPFFGVEVIRPSMLAAVLDGPPAARLLVMSFDEEPALAARLERLDMPADRVVWL